MSDTTEAKNLWQIMQCQVKLQQEKTSNPKVYDIENVYTHFLHKMAERCTDSEFDVDEENRDVLKLITMYICNSPLFEQQKQSSILRSIPRLDAGLLLVGNPGSGKTLIMKAIEDLKIDTCLMNVLYCDQITESYEIEGPRALVKYSSIYNQSNRVKSPYCFDDLGYERKSVGHFGSKANCMMDIIMKQERLFKDHNHKSHFTSNYSLTELAAIYDLRTESRLSEMCNVIVLGGKADSKDRRKKYQKQF